MGFFFEFRRKINSYFIHSPLYIFFSITAFNDSNITRTRFQHSTKEQTFQFRVAIIVLDSCIHTPDDADTAGASLFQQDMYTSHGLHPGYGLVVSVFSGG